MNKLLTRLTVHALLGAAALILSACGDPGTGGSGVPTGASGGTDNATTGAAAAPPSAAPDTANPSFVATADGQTIDGVIEAEARTDETGLSSQNGPILVVAGTRFALATAQLIGTDGAARGIEQLKLGVPVKVRVAQGANIAAGAANGAGAPISALALIISDPLPGRLMGVGASTTVEFDDGSRLALSPTVVIAGMASGTGIDNSRVRAWVQTISTAGGAANLVSRYEFE